MVDVLVVGSFVVVLKLTLNVAVSWTVGPAAVWLAWRLWIMSRRPILRTRMEDAHSEVSV
jgi:hypothetical protein